MFLGCFGGRLGRHLGASWGVMGRLGLPTFVKGGGFRFFLFFVSKLLGINKPMASAPATVFVFVLYVWP